MNIIACVSRKNGPGPYSIMTQGPELGCGQKSGTTDIPRLLYHIVTCLKAIHISLRLKTRTMESLYGKAISVIYFFNSEKKSLIIIKFLSV